jgi:anti-sigma factor RsiW
MTNDIYKVAKPRMNTSCQNIVSADSDYQSSQPCLEHIAMSQHRDLDVTKRDRFELLSAYLDGEVSPEERRLVTTWLADDPETQCLYQRLLHLRRGFQGLCHERWQSETAQITAQAVIGKLNQRLRLTYMAGMTAAAVAVIGVFSGAFNDPMSRFGVVQSPTTKEGLEIALDQPPILIPKPAAVAGTTPMDAVLPETGASGLVEQAL